MALQISSGPSMLDQVSLLRWVPGLVSTVDGEYNQLVSFLTEHAVSAHNRGVWSVRPA